MISLAAFALATCFSLPAGAENITAADIHLEGVPPERVLSLAPSPGVARVFHPAELRRMAAQFPSAAVPEDDVCVERSMAALDPAQLLEAMSKILPEAHIEIADYSRQLAPQGELEFRRAGLRKNAGSGATWFGAIRYAPNREFTIWAKVSVTVPAVRVIALTALLPGTRVDASQLHLETREEFPSTQAFVGAVEEATGRYPLTAIPAGAPILKSALEPPGARAPRRSGGSGRIQRRRSSEIRGPCGRERFHWRTDPGSKSGFH